jgi:hypothetical protein
MNSKEMIMAIKDVNFRLLPSGWKPKRSRTRKPIGSWITRNLVYIAETHDVGATLQLGDGIEDREIDGKRKGRERASHIASVIKRGEVCPWCKGKAPKIDDKKVCPHWEAEWVEGDGEQKLRKGELYVIVTLVKKG